MIKLCSDISEIIFILENMRDEDKQELISLYGKNWKEETLNQLKDKEVLILYGSCGKFGQKPIAMGGFYEQFKNEKALACVWLLSSFYIYKNKILFLKELKRQILKGESKYKVMYNFIHKSNFTSKNWLRKFGFKFDNPNPNQIEIKEGFEFFYKLS